MIPGFYSVNLKTYRQNSYYYVSFITKFYSVEKSENEIKFQYVYNKNEIE